MFALDTDGPSLIERGTDRLVRWESASMLMLYRRFLDGEDIGPQCAWVLDVMGESPDYVVPAVRVFGMANEMDGGKANGGDELWPQRYGERFYWALPDFGAFLAAAGLWFSFVVFANARTILPRHSDRQRHLDRLFEIAQDLPNMAIEQANEPSVDEFDLRAVRPSNPGRVLWATGAYDFVADDRMPTGRILLYHGDRGRIDEGPLAGEFSHCLEAGKEPHFYRDGSRDAQHNWPGFPGPVGDDEPMGFGEQPTNRWGDERDTNPDHAEDHAAASATGAAWLTFHSEDGCLARVPGPITTACARRWFAAAHLIPVDAVRGRYAHDTFAGHPLVNVADGPGYATESVSRRLPDGSWIVVSTDPAFGYVPIAKPGRTIAQVLNARGNILRVT